MVLEGLIRPGDRLPPEISLAEQMGVSRAVLREGMRLLEAQGLLVTKPGVGTVLREADASQIVEPLQWLAAANYGGITFDEFHAVRTILETQVAGLAAERAGPDGVDHLQAAMRDMLATVGDGHAFAEHDARFHHTLATLTDNRLLEILMSAIRQLIADHVQSVVEHLDPTADVIPFHEDILAAVKAGDPAAARAAMTLHLDKVRQNFQAAYVARTRSGKEPWSDDGFRD